MRPLVSSALPATTGAVAVPRDARRHFGAARAADVGQESLQHGEVRGAVGLQRQRLIDQVHRAAEIELGVVADHLQRIDLQHLVLDAQPNRRLIAQPVIEQRAG